ncbi:Acg family FMN-binding oxidoreductase [Modestobacter sp. SYSU DS0511]
MAHGEGTSMLDADRWTQVVERAVRAPSIHNTQPWSFRADRDRLEVRHDPSRALPAVDPTGRQQVLSVGVAVELAVVALAALGVAAEVEVLPDPADPELVAVVRVTGEHEPSAADQRAAEAIGQRHTERARFLGQPLPAGLVERLERTLGRDGVWLKLIDHSEEETAVSTLLGEAEESEQRDPAYLAELRAWTRTDPASPDGVPAAAVPDGEQRTSNMPVRDFGTARPAPAAVPDDDDPPPPVEHPSVLLLGTVADDRAAWVGAGMALGRLLLELTQAGLVASPLTQALDQSWARARLTRRLDLVGHPQMLLRLGAPSGAAVSSGRRPVAEVLTLA